MPNLMQRGAAWLGEKQKVASGRTVRIRRQQQQTAPIIGWVHKHEYDEIGDDGIATTVVMDDWTFTAADIVIGGNQVELRDNDMIVETLNGVEILYQVSPVRGHRSVEWLDTSGILLLVHSNRVKRDD